MHCLNNSQQFVWSLLHAIPPFNLQQLVFLPAGPAISISMLLAEMRQCLGLWSTWPKGTAYSRPAFSFLFHVWNGQWLQAQTPVFTPRGADVLPWGLGVPLTGKGLSLTILNAFQGHDIYNEPLLLGSLPLHHDLLPIWVFLGDHSGCFWRECSVSRAAAHCKSARSRWSPALAQHCHRLGGTAGDTRRQCHRCLFDTYAARQR